MICPRCYEERNWLQRLLFGRREVRLVSETTTEHFHDPQDSAGHGERQFEILVCQRCGYTEESEYPSPEEDDEEF